ncbi:hypothetical protein L0337_01115 [candidate division KSB1 bacterium]|nr:hypothetical protein [candidate division KSB1 bacterium]
MNLKIDVVLLVECIVPPEVMLTALNEKRIKKYHYAPGIGCKKVEIFVRFSSEFIQPIHEEDRLTIRHLALPGKLDLLLAVTHFPSKLSWSESSQALECIELARSIRFAEKKISHSRTVLVGDLNMNPFEDGVISAHGLHGVMSRSLANKKSRIVQSKEYAFFYNPMWNLLGDATPGAPGTFYYNDSQPIVFFWNMFDQVLIRPDLLSIFHNEDLKIITVDKNGSFLSKQGIPDKDRLSDHLPIFFKLRL